VPMTFSFGNTHEEIPKAKANRARSNKSMFNTHRWALFMIFNNDEVATKRLIKSVTYHLDPDFKPSVIKVSKAPFLLSRIGWGDFTLDIDIEFQWWTGLKTQRIEHDLSFDGKGKTHSLTLEVPADALEKNIKSTAAELSKLLAKYNAM